MGVLILNRDDAGRVAWFCRLVMVAELGVNGVAGVVLLDGFSFFFLNYNFLFYYFDD